jgi:sodium-dependent dicarboxylate transporter 2/3/5
VLDTRPAPPAPRPAPPPVSDGDGETPAFVRRVGLIGGVAAFLVMRLVPGPTSLEPEGWAAASVMVLMAAWWLTEAVPIAVTALLPLVLFPVLELMTMQEAATPYANEVIFLFMGGFFLAKSMEKWGLHRRIALAIVARMGASPSRVLLGFMAGTCFVSMWISNTSTAAMMLAPGLAVAGMLRPTEGPGATGKYNFGIALMLGIAYASSIGGVGTLIGTPPNTLFAAAALELADVRVGFLQWMLVGTPFAWIMLVLTWLILVRVYPPEQLRGDAAALLEAQRRELGPMSRGERLVSVVFALTVLAWVMREPKALGALTIPGIATWLPGVTDGTIAMVAALVLFVFPLDWKRGDVALDWASAVTIPWGVLLLFGGGLSLAAAMAGTGLASWIGGGIAGLAGWPTAALIAAAATLFIFMGEITSNTAMTAMGMPVMAGVAVTLGMEPVVLMASVAVACSMGFMLPAGTPPNAIVFGSGYLTIGQMARAGIWVNLLSIVLVTILGTFVFPLLF